MTCEGCGRFIVRALYARPSSWEEPRPFCNTDCMRRYQWEATEDAIDAACPGLAPLRGDDLFDGWNPKGAP